MKLGNMSVNIELDEIGVYSLGLEGGTGKTRLYRSLRLLENITTDVLAITYDKNLSEDAIIRKIEEFNGKYLLMDRFDLYKTDAIIQAIKAKGCLVFLDLKAFDGWQKLKRKECKVIQQKNGITICKG